MIILPRSAFTWRASWVILVLGLGILAFASPLEARDASHHAVRGIGAPAVPPLDDLIPIDSCRDITAPGSYQLVTDLKPFWHCLTIAASYVTLDCDGKSIQGRDFVGSGIVVERFGPNSAISPENITIRNCRISRHQYGIFVEGARNVHIVHNDLSHNFDDTGGTYSGPWMGTMEGGGLRMNQTQDSVIEDNISNYGSNGIDIRDSQRAIVRNNTTTLNTGFGILLSNTNHSQVVGNRVIDNTRWCSITDGEFKGFIVQGCDTAGILLQDGASSNVVANNIIQGQNGDGIFIRAHGGMRCGDGNEVVNNQISGALWNSVEAGFCTGLKVAGNQIAGSKIGVWVSFMDKVQILNNTFAGMEQYGVAIKNSHHAVITGNTFRDSPEGVYFFWDPNNTVVLHKPFDTYTSYGNTVTGNSFYAMRVAAIHLKDSTRNRVAQNVFDHVTAVYWNEGNTAGNVLAGQ